jgi:hypothetical protein
MFRFTIRDLLWLMVVVGLFFAWVMEQESHENDRAKFAAKLKECGADPKVRELADIEAIINYPRPGENAVESIRKVLDKRSMPKETYMSRVDDDP